MCVLKGWLTAFVGDWSRLHYIGSQFVIEISQINKFGLQVCKYATTTGMYEATANNIDNNQP